MKKLLLFASLVLSINTFSAYVNSATTFSSKVDKQSMIIPAYNYPDGVNDQYWNSVTALGGSKVPYVIINPDNGSGNNADPNYIRQIEANKNAGIKSIGYIRTKYRGRSVAEVVAEVDTYFRLYGENNISGFFFDEIKVDENSSVEYMESIYNYVKSKSADKLVMGNPGRQINDKMAPYADIFVTSEISADEYINRFSAPKSEFENNSANSRHIMHIVYGATPDQYETIVKLSRERNAGWLIITDDTQPNPYDGLPTDINKIAKLINNLGGIPNPNNSGGGLGSIPKTGIPQGVFDKKSIAIPRSKVDLDLVKSSRGTIYRNMENIKEDGITFDTVYIGQFGTDFKEKNGNVKYSSSSNGILLSIFKDYGKFNLGGGFGYQKSKVRYGEKFSGIKENIDSFQFLFGGKYKINENIDLSGVVTYSENIHKYRNENGRVFMDGAKYNSKILDADTRIGYKYMFEKGYIKPYLGLGITSVREGEISKLGIKGTSATGLNSIIGLYAQLNYGNAVLFGNVEYEQRLRKKSYHNRREYNVLFDIAPLEYKRGVFNAGLGIGYKLSDMLNVILSYELSESRNNVFKLGLEAEF
ncbi:autotransporter protein [Leptotrichia sp. OH3620_COT-345]|uniref:spherulation-specific family 4 protein n=1 Tax=Leptotrichia sp. OH3620_COT-345 TaxID=2491048 RepID=UPI000F6488B7|nr:spherulation-specific family 4 protein [Leptotrichia sp. OH3620_COT-345]RRD39490.1 autotransporter protein [Leptotrichia sp. OH3620_COT-345]